MGTRHGTCYGPTASLESHRNWPCLYFCTGLLLIERPASPSCALWLDVVLCGKSPAPQQNQAPDPIVRVSQNVVRIGQLDPAQYSSSQEYNAWAYSACSSAAMTEVIN